jgi:hypothetical protein
LGAAGVIFHFDSHFFYERTLRSLTYAAPFAAPLAYMGLGCLLLMNRMVPARSEEWSKWVLFFGRLRGEFRAESYRSCRQRLFPSVGMDSGD